MGGLRKACALLRTAAPDGVAQIGPAGGAGDGVGEVAGGHRPAFVAGPLQARQRGRHGAALLGGVDQVGVGVVVAVHRDEVASEVDLRGEVVQVVGVQLQAGRASGGEGGGDVLPGLAGRGGLLDVQRQAQPIGHGPGDRGRLGAAAEEREVHVLGVPVDEAQTFAEAEQHGLGQLEALVAQQGAERGGLAVLTGGERDVLDDHVTSWTAGRDGPPTASTFPLGQGQPRLPQAIRAVT